MKEDALIRITGRSQVSRRDFVRSTIGVLAAPAVIGCGVSRPDTTGPPPSVGSARLTARPGSPTLTPDIGSSALGLGPGSRDGLLYVPTGYSPDTPSPLLVLLHGATGQASNWVNYEARAEARNLVLLAPDSRSGTWDLLEGSYGVDVEFIDLALQHTFDRIRVDPTRVALVGFSDGASYALSLGVSNGDLFSHLVGFSPGFMLGVDPIVGRPPVSFRTELPIRFFPSL